MNSVLLFVMKPPVLITLFVFASLYSFSQALQRDSIFHSHDSTFEIKTWKELNLIREFIRFEGKEEFYYKEFDFKTLHLKAEGLLKSGLCTGNWRFYKKKGKLDHQVNFEPVHTKSYTTADGPYADLFKYIKQKCDSLLEQKKEKSGNFLFHFHSSQSYYYRFGFTPNGNTYKQARPNSFLMRYDLVFNDGQLFRTFAYVELELDSLGNIKKENYSSLMTDYKNVDFISMKSAASIALKNGLDDADQPLGFKFLFITDSVAGKKGKIILRVTGKFFDRKKEIVKNGISITLYFRYTDLNPWTGEVIGSGADTITEINMQ
jgi:hypothetical protein